MGGNIYTINDAADALTTARQVRAAINEFLESLSPEEKETAVVNKATVVIARAENSIDEMQRIIGHLSIG